MPVKTKLFKNDREGGPPWSNAKVTIDKAGSYRVSIFRNDDGSLYMSMYHESEQQQLKRGYQPQRQRELPVQGQGGPPADWDDSF